MPETTPERKLIGVVTAFMLAGSLVTACGGGNDDDGMTGPEISSIDTQGSPVLPGNQVEVTVSATGGSLSYDWTIPDGWSEIDNGEVDRLSLIAPESQAAAGQVSVTVSNSAGSASAEVTVATHGPAIEDFSVDVSGNAATLSVTAYNHDSRDLTYHYSVAGTLQVQDQGSEWSWSAAAGGRYELEATVRDSDGLTAVASLEVTLAGVSAWPTASGNRQRTGRKPQSSPQQANGTKKWDTDTLIGGTPTPPAIGPNGTVYVGSWNGDTDVYAIDPDTGTQVWSFSGTGDSVFDSLSVGPNGTVYVGSADNNIYALDPDTGDKLWNTGSGVTTYRTATVGTDGTVYVGHSGGGIQALDPNDNGNEIWSHNTAAIKRSLAIAVDGTIYGGDYSGTVYALDPSKEELTESEREIWTFDAGNNAAEVAPALGADGTIYVADYDWDNDGGTVYALHPSKENLSDSERTLWSLDIAPDPEEEFDIKLPNSLTVGADGTIYAGFGDTLYALDPSEEDLSKSERILWSFTEPDGNTFYSSPAITADGTLYVGSEAGRLFAIDTETGATVWPPFTEPGGSVSSPALAADGTIYVSSNDNKVYAIE